MPTATRPSAATRPSGDGLAQPARAKQQRKHRRQKHKRRHLGGRVAPASTSRPGSSQTPPTGLRERAHANARSPTTRARPAPATTEDVGRCSLPLVEQLIAPAPRAGAVLRWPPWSVPTSAPRRQPQRIPSQASGCAPAARPASPSPSASPRPQTPLPGQSAIARCKAARQEQSAAAATPARNGELYKTLSAARPRCMQTHARCTRTRPQTTPRPAGGRPASSWGSSARATRPRHRHQAPMAAVATATAAQGLEHRRHLGHRGLGAAPAGTW